MITRPTDLYQTLLEANAIRACWMLEASVPWSE